MVEADAVQGSEAGGGSLGAPRRGSDGTLEYRAFSDPQSSRVFLWDLAKHVTTLEQVWTDPHTLDPARQKARVTRKIAGHIAELSGALEAAGHAPDLVASS